MPCPVHSPIFEIYIRIAHSIPDPEKESTNAHKDILYSVDLLRSSACYARIDWLILWFSILVKTCFVGVMTENYKETECVSIKTLLERKLWLSSIFSETITSLASPIQLNTLGPELPGQSRTDRTTFLQPQQFWFCYKRWSISHWLCFINWSSAWVDIFR